MKVNLWKKPKNATIVEGFPGFGLVGTIACEFLIDHLQTEMIGRIEAEEMPPVVAIHDKKAIEPLGIFYNKKYNIVILHVVTASKGFEWKLADAILDIAKQITAKEVISLEGVGSNDVLKIASNAFYHTSDTKKKASLEKAGLKPLAEGIIMGVTGALLLKAGKTPITCFFADTASNLPDSKAAAKVVEALDNYLGLKVDPKPLMQQAAKFEGKLRDVLTSAQKTEEIADKKNLSYVG